MRKSITLILCLFIFYGQAQKVNWKKLDSLKSDKILLSGGRQPTKVLLLGTFHFAYPQADGHKVDSANFIDVLSAQRQKEIQELTDVIAKFKPTRIYVESSRHGFHDSLYAEYVKGTYKPGRNEIYQIGYRVAKQMNHPDIHTVDAGSFAGDNYKKYRWIDSMWSTKDFVDTTRDNYWQGMYKRLYTTGDSVETKLTMLESFLLMAEPHNLARMHGHYLAAGFNTKTDDGPDILSMWWYSRNLRIFNNILKTQPASEDRIVVLFGNGHMPILKHCFQSSPEFEVVELKSLLK